MSMYADPAHSTTCQVTKDGYRGLISPVFFLILRPVSTARDAVQAGSHQVSASLIYVRELINWHAGIKMRF